ncbi:MAG: YfhO family protein [Bacilli bacterium]|nr:YfhO family protein [Bacilli bacterium]
MKNKKYVLMSFLIPCIMMILLYLSVGVIGGNKNILTVDLADQYIAFFNALKNIFNGTISPFYTFSKTLGGNFFGIITYYLMSPFNLLTVFFKISNMPTCILIINILKISFAGLTSYIYFSKSFKQKKISLMFSIIYSLMAYNIVYSQNIMWLDGVILLPLIFLGIDKLIDNKPLLFYLSLTISIICNYYIGYMSCIGSLIYFVYKSYLNEKKIVIKKIASFIKYLLLAVLTSSVILIPSILYLLGGKADGILTEFIPNQKFPLLDIITRFYIGSFKTSDLEGGCPNIYISLISIVLVIYYFFNSKIDKQEKKATFILISVFLISFIVYPIDVIWHTFKHPYGFPFRYSFIFDFILLIIAFKSILNIDKIEKTFIKKFLLYSLILTIVIDKLLYTSNMYYKVFGTFILLTIYLLYLAKRKSKTISNFILLLVVAEMFINSYLIVLNIKYQDKEKYEQFINTTGNIINNINDESFYRLEKDYSYSTNDELLLNYNGISHFSSVYEGSNNELLGKYLGIFNRFYITNYNGSTLVTNSLFNIKYLLSKRNLSYYSKIKTSNGINTYLNKYNLPLGFMADSNILNIELEEYEPFINQNNILKSMDKQIENVFYKNEYNIKLNNLKLDDKLTYKKLNKNKDASLKITVNLNHSGLLYGYLSSKTHQKIDILLDGNSIIDINDQNNYYYNILELGEFYKSDKVDIEILLLEDTLKLDDIMFYTLDLEKFNNAINILNNNTKIEINEFKQDYIKATIDTPKDKILYTSIPYDDGFKVFVDGKKTNKNKCLNTLLCLDLEPGHHEIVLKYETRGLKIGIIMSALGILGFIMTKKKSKD